MPSYRVWLLPHLLSLDAPLVAISWQLLLSRTVVPIPRAQTAILCLSVWLVYVGDRVLDGLRPPTANEAPRHSFARRFRLPLIAAAIVVLAVNATLAVGYLEPVRFERGVVLLLLVIAHFLITHRLSVRWAKELWIGLIFAAGVWLPALVGASGQWPAAVIFTGLCWWNCVAIEAWESGGSHRSRWHSTTRWLADRLAPAALALTVAALLLFVATRQPAAAAESLSACLFWLLHRYSGKLSPDQLRLAVDMALLTPVLF